MSIVCLLRNPEDLAEFYLLLLILFYLLYYYTVLIDIRVKFACNRDEVSNNFLNGLKRTDIVCYVSIEKRFVLRSESDAFVTDDCKIKISKLFQ